MYVPATAEDFVYLLAHRERVFVTVIETCVHKNMNAKRGVFRYTKKWSYGCKSKQHKRQL